MTSVLLLFTVLIIATCGLVYELLAGSVASYVLGDSITQFSTVIGVYLSALGLGSFLSKYIERHVARRFVEIELLVALVGGVSAPLLFIAFAHLSFFRPILYGVVAAVGTFVGLEIPLLLRILKDRYEFKDLIARVLTFDYVGGLLASLAFPIFLVPQLGLVRTSLVFGMLNAAVGLGSTWLLKPMLGRTGLLRAQSVFVLVLLAAGVVGAERLTTLSESGVYADPIVFARSSPYQRLVITRGRNSFQLFLNGNLQFSSADEYRYHEALVHPAMSLRPGARHALVLGGGDGLAVRELLRYPALEKITLVDLDPEMIRAARENPLMRSLNEGSLDSPKVEVINQDAYVWLHEKRGPFDVAIVDFPDPNNFSLGKLYTTRFYKLLRQSLSPGAPVVVQSTSPLMARASFWCVVRTMEKAGFETKPFHAFVPSFGEWGYVLALDRPFDVPDKLHVSGLRYLTDESLPTLFVMPPDMGPVPVEANQLNNQILVQYYESEWRRWN
ncbi:MAG: polyamine aminopropyltransferase [Myxococcales bacterium]